ncbi:hypothetical protein [Acetobacter fallax]|uniref:Uncharacterized protein n=1 Tax=Acetobacter fallax TaxID=1737473 RepID=A0ABX0KBN1_9PROT|nr:hypothetical protein [Acetobacter fallax]NHO32583.1 hypothetical protein [Acetobacter fallax]NHO36072.1 hypothetical protein [Acetobacter fallax]
MDYDNLEQHIYENDIAIYDIITALHPFYRYKLYQLVAEKSGLSTDNDANELALNVVRMLSIMKKSVVDSFELTSFSYAELQSHQRITGTKLARKADKARINMRRVLGLSIEDDEVQQDFNLNKRTRYESIKIMGRSVQDSINAKKKNNRSRDWMISQCLNSSMQLAGMTRDNDPTMSGSFLSGTLPRKYRGLSFEQCNEEINNRLNNIKKYADRKGIIWTGVYVIELHKDETPHIHIIYYVDESQRLELLDIIFKFFWNENPDNPEVDQRIPDFEGVLGYIFKDYGKPNTRHGFIGLRRDIRTIWNNLYIKNFGDKSLSYLSSNRLFHIRKMMDKKSINDKIEGIHGYILFSLKGFKSDYLNSIGKNDEPIKYVGLSRKIREMRTYINVFIDTNLARNFYKNTRVRCYVLYFGYSYLYINTKIVLDGFFRFEIIESRGQPPPKWKGLDYFFILSKNIIS